MSQDFFFSSGRFAVANLVAVFSLATKGSVQNAACINLSVMMIFLLQCREIGDELHEEILRILHELHTTMKTYHGYQTEMRAAEMKLRLAEGQRQKVELSTPAEKLPRLKKYRLIEKEVQKVRMKNC